MARAGGLDRIDHVVVIHSLNGAPLLGLGHSSGVHLLYQSPGSVMAGQAIEFGRATKAGDVVGHLSDPLQSGRGGVGFQGEARGGVGAQLELG